MILTWLLVCCISGIPCAPRDGGSVAGALWRWQCGWWAVTMRGLGFAIHHTMPTHSRLCLGYENDSWLELETRTSLYSLSSGSSLFLSQCLQPTMDMHSAYSLQWWLHWLAGYTIHDSDAGREEKENINRREIKHEYLENRTWSRGNNVRVFVSSALLQLRDMNSTQSNQPFRLTWR
jgi:hypothetical protein